MRRAVRKAGLVAPAAKVANEGFAILHPPALDDATINLAGPFTRIEKVGRAIVSGNQVVEAARSYSLCSWHDGLGGEILHTSLIFLSEAFGPR